MHGLSRPLYPFAWQTPADIQRAIKAREALLVPVFTQIAHSFADLHDTPGRMLAKGCIDRVVPWRTARRELFLRLRRRLVGHGGYVRLLSLLQVSRAACAQR